LKLSVQFEKPLTRSVNFKARIEKVADWIEKPRVCMEKIAGRAENFIDHITKLRESIEKD
jgi:hypothetical protein